MNRMISKIGFVALIVAIIVAIIDIFVNKDLFVYWIWSFIIHQFTVGYSYYFEENRKIWGILIMGTIIGGILFILFLRIT